MMSDTTIALALLKANWEEHRQSYLDNFNLLTAECLRQSKEEVASAAQLVCDLKSLFGLVVPVHVAEVLLNRAAKTKLLTKEHRAYFINRSVVEESDFDERRSKVAAAYDTLVRKLVRFAKERFDVEWSEQQAEGVLHDYLNENALDLVRATTRRSAMSLPRRASKSQKYILASFVKEAIDNDFSSLAPLKMVIEGTLLVSAIFLPQPANLDRRFRDTSVFLDTSILLRALGHCGESLRDAARQLLDLLTAHGARLACFEHTYDEVYSILNASAMGLSGRPTGYGTVFDHFLEKGFSESDVRLILATLRRDLQSIEVEVREKPEYEIRYTIDETELEKAIRVALQYLNPNALRRDVDSLSAVIRLRRGKAPRDLEQARAIFATSNNPLSRAGNEFYRRDLGEEEFLAPVCISEWHLTSLLWLKRPLERPELPQKRMIADFHAAINPSEGFMRRYVEEIGKLETSGGHSAEDVFFLRHSLEARRVAMDRTLGDEEAFTQGTVSEVLEIVQKGMRAEGEAELAAEQERSARLEQELQGTRSELTEVLERGQRDEEFRRMGRTRLANRWARWTSRAVVIVVGALVVVAVYSATPDLPLPRALEVPLVRVVAAILALLMCLANWFRGLNLSGLERSLRSRIQRSIVRRLEGELES